MNTIKPIKTKKDHENALKLLEELIDKNPKPETNESEQLEVLAIVIEKYEKENFPITSPDPIEAIKYVMDQHDLTQADMIPCFGSRSRVSEVLSGKKALTLEMIRNLRSQWGIPVELLI